MSVLVNIVIPVYNIESYIGNCLNSLINQTYSNIEIICIDDGSSDGSAGIIKAMAAKDARIKYFFQENSGVSAARNFGLHKATGDYITFVDGDDYLHNRAIELFVDCALKTGADMVFADYVETSSLDHAMPTLSEPVYKEFSFTGQSIEREDLLKPVWAKLIKSSVAKSQQFNREYYICEDVNYTVKLINESKNIYFINEGLYYYYIRAASAMRSTFSMKRFSAVYAYSDLCDFLKDTRYSAILGFALRNLYMYIFSCRTFAKYSPLEKEVRKQSKIIAKKHLSDFLKSKTISIKMKVVILGFLVSRHLYEFARLRLDPTMKDFYKNRKAESKN